MPWVRDKVELRREFVERARAGESIAKLCRDYGVSRPTGYLWLKRFEEHGTIKSLYDRSHRPAHCPHRTPTEVEELVVALRERYWWGADKLRVLLERDHGIELPRITINRIIKRNGLLIREECKRPALKRFERETPNELWQADLKGCLGQGVLHCEPLSILDDHSRFLVGLHPARSSKLEPIQDAFLSTFLRYGLPQGILVDHGCPWWGTSHYSGLTKLSVWLMRQDIKLHFSGYNHPQTQGKVERFHRTLNATIRHRTFPTAYEQWEPLLDDIRFEYNTIRPHEALDMQVPADRYVPSNREYNPDPPPVEYPDGFIVRKTGTGGRFVYKGKRLVSSQALEDEYIGIKELEHTALIYYRKTPLREVDLRTGKSVSFEPRPRQLGPQ